jgi:cellulose synthase/poly-beta-1,6-N-acetylglucosamine synthase-like glycosyltransferase
MDQLSIVQISMMACQTCETPLSVMTFDLGPYITKWFYQYKSPVIDLSNKVYSDKRANHEQAENNYKLIMYFQTRLICK